MGVNCLVGVGLVGAGVSLCIGLAKAVGVGLVGAGLAGLGWGLAKAVVCTGSGLVGCGLLLGTSPLVEGELLGLATWLDWGDTCLVGAAGLPLLDPELPLLLPPPLALFLFTLSTNSSTGCSGCRSEISLL